MGIFKSPGLSVSYTTWCLQLHLGVRHSARETEPSGHPRCCGPCKPRPASCCGEPRPQLDSPYPHFPIPWRGQHLGSSLSGPVPPWEGTPSGTECLTSHCEVLACAEHWTGWQWSPLAPTLFQVRLDSRDSSTRWGLGRVANLLPHCSLSPLAPSPIHWAT